MYSTNKYPVNKYQANTFAKAINRVYNTRSRSIQRPKTDCLILSPYHTTLNICSKDIQSYLGGKLNKVRLNDSFYQLVKPIKPTHPAKVSSNVKTDEEISEIADYADFYNFSNSTNVDHYLNKLISDFIASNFIKLNVHWYLNLNKILFHIMTTTYDQSSNELVVKNKIHLDLNNINQTYSIDHTWVSPSKTRNYMLDDPLIDYLDYNNLTEPSDIDNILKKRQIKCKRKKPEPESEHLELIFANGKEFENRIIQILEEAYPGEIFTMIDSDNDSNWNKKLKDPNYYELTIKLIKMGIPIICQSVFHNLENKTYGLPDLLIRADYIQKIFSTDIDIHTQPMEKTGQLPYYVVDIKNSTIHLSANSDNVLNNISVKPYKAQIAIYYQTLEQIQGYHPKAAKGFILSSKWERIVKKQHLSSTDPFDRLGIIDFSNNDSNYLETASDAIEWLKLIRMPDNNLNCLEPNNPNLYPNMCNQFDGKYKKIKQYLAERNSEITSLWRCGVQHRKKALKNGISKWSDPKLTSDVLGINGQTANIIDKMLKLNRSDNLLIQPSKIESKLFDWRNLNHPNNLTFYIDFETINTTSLEQKEMYEHNSTNSNDIIFMIGVGYVLDQKWSYKNFTLEDLSESSQINMIRDFLSYLDGLTKEHNQLSPNLYHWSAFEPLVLNKTCAKFGISLDPYIKILNWSDLLKLFHTEPILIKGALNFSLKTIGKKMYEQNMIQTCWSESNEIKNGLEAMVQAYQLYNKYAKYNKYNQIQDMTPQRKRPKLDKSDKSNHPDQKPNILEDRIMKKIIEYNHVDCQIMYDILKYLVQNH